MTDGQNELIDSVDQEALSSAQNAAQAPVQESGASEKMLSQAEVNELAGKIRHDSYEKAKREMAQAAQQQGSSHEAQRVSQGAMSEDQIRRAAMEEAQKFYEGQTRAMAAQRVVSEFQGKMAAGKEKFEDFEEKLSGFDLTEIPEVVALANGVDNTDEVMYELANFPEKLVNLTNAARTSPQLARRIIDNLSNSIKNNRTAKEAYAAPEALGQVKPSTLAVDKDPESVMDYMKQSWLQR